MIVLGRGVINDFPQGETRIGKMYLGDTLVYQDGDVSQGHIETMTLIRHWSGTDAPDSSKWYDRIGNQYWTLTNATHEGNYYEFLNSIPNNITAVGQLNGKLPDLCYHWKIIADAAVKVNDSATGMVVVDFGSIRSTSDGSCNTAIYLVSSSHKWGMNAKFDGNSSGSTYNPDSTNLVDPDFENDAWIRRTITIGVKESSTSGKDVAYMNVSNVGYGETPTPFEPLRFNRWTSNQSYLARGGMVNATYKYSTNLRIYDLKVYYEPIV